MKRSEAAVAATAGSVARRRDVGFDRLDASRLTQNNIARQHEKYGLPLRRAALIAHLAGLGTNEAA